jgi:hypothetical protein
MIGGCPFKGPRSLHHRDTDMPASYMSSAMSCPDMVNTLADTSQRSGKIEEAARNNPGHRTEAGWRNRHNAHGTNTKAQIPVSTAGYT